MASSSWYYPLQSQTFYHHHTLPLARKQVFKTVTNHQNEILEINLDRPYFHFSVKTKKIITFDNLDSKFPLSVDFFLGTNKQAAKCFSEGQHSETSGI